MIRRSYFFCFLALFALCNTVFSQDNITGINVIPKPNSMRVNNGKYNLNKKINVFIDGSVKDKDFVFQLLKRNLSDNIVSTKDNADIRLIIDKNDSLGNEESYKLTVTPSLIDVIAYTDKGLFYGLQTLFQLKDKQGYIQSIQINDRPRFAYRGVMLDCSRHFMSVDFIKRLLTQMSRFKLNTFHWHIVDGGGWRMESKKYPLLQQKATIRTESDWDKWWQGSQKFLEYGDKNGYGDFYTQEQIKEIVDHASKLHINIIPEIEMPGHSNELFAAYPELSCGGSWGKNISEVCPANEKVYRFYEDILSEVMALFPSKYIHIGGDEASKDEWKKCPRCKELMAKEGFSSPEQLQSYMITRMEKFLNKHGREIIGWDEILEGGLAPGATVMSWRGEEGGIKAANMNHNVVMTPGKYLYLDFYQANPETEPRAIGGYTPIKQVYSYNPIPKELPQDKHKYVLGAQANLWTEYVPDEKHAEYMLFPRILALSEVDWTNQDIRDYKDFMRRVNYQNKEMIAKGINAFPLKNIDVRQVVDTQKKEIVVFFEAEQNPATIRYTLDGKTPDKNSSLYDDSKGVVVKTKANIVAALFDKDGKMLYSPVSIKVNYHKAIGKKVTYEKEFMYKKQYEAGGDGALTDGYVGRSSHTDGTWQGFMSNIDLTVDMEKATNISKVSARFMDSAGAWIHIPGDMSVYYSNDNKKWSLLGVCKAPKISPKGKPLFIDFNVAKKAKARFIKIKATNVQDKGHWLFVDEVVVE